jgi:hypothetical protein
VALLIALPIGGPSPDPQADRVGSGSAVRLRAAPASQRPSAASHAGVQSLRSARTIAGRQLRKAGRELRTCARRTPASMLSWRSCVRWPLAHLVIDGRVSGGVLYAIAERGGIGHCREQALGEASGLRLLGGLSDQLVHGLPNSSSQAAAEAARLFEATRSLIVDLRRQLRRPVRACLNRG